jgi:hypothetical protein
MTQHHLPLLELLAAERGRELRRDAERHRLIAAARAAHAAHRAAAARPARPDVGLARTSLFRAGELLVACGAALVRWANSPTAPHAARWEAAL